jgi:hypothetical protein
MIIFSSLAFACASLFFMTAAASGEGKEPLELADLRQGKLLFMSAINVQILPAEAEVVYGQAVGTFRLMRPSGAKLQEDELWGVLNPESLRLERRQLETTSRQLPEQIAMVKLTHEENIAKARLALNEAKTELAEFRALAGSKEFVGGDEMKDLVEQATEELKASVERAESKLELIEKGVGQEAEVEKLELAHEREQKALEDLVYESEFRAPFAGELQLMGELNKQSQAGVPREVRISSGEPLAIIKNEEAYRVLVEPLQLDFEGVSRSRLLMIIDSEKGKGEIRARFASLETDPRDPTSVANWVFSVADEDVEDVKSRSTGSRALASIFLELEQEAYLVSKAVLLRRLPAAGSQPRSWRRALAQLLPNCELVAEGKGALAVRLREEEEEAGAEEP